MAICKALPARLDKLQATPYGWQASALYAVYGGVLSFAVHGWYCTFVDRERQLQTYEKRGTPFSGTMEDRISYREKEQPRVAAIRQLATFATSLVYSVYPFASATTSWLSFVAWTCALAVYWDIHFFIVHKIAHENKHAYKWLHKLHHTYKQPDVFSAYCTTAHRRTTLGDHVVVPHARSLTHAPFARVRARALGSAPRSIPPRFLLLPLSSRHIPEPLLHRTVRHPRHGALRPACGRLHVDAVVWHARLVHQARRAHALGCEVAAAADELVAALHAALALGAHPRLRHHGRA